MPCFKLFTSLSRDKIPENFVKRLIQVLGRTLRKPEKSFTIVISNDCIVDVGLNNQSVPAAAATLESIGNLGIEENRLITREVSSFIQNELGITSDNLFMSFYDVAGHNIGKGGVTRT